MTWKPEQKWYVRAKKLNRQELKQKCSSYAEAVSEAKKVVGYREVWIEEVDNRSQPVAFRDLDPSKRSKLPSDRAHVLNIECD